MSAPLTSAPAIAERTARWRTWLPLRLPSHRASSATLAGVYPFLASTPLDRGVYVGTDAFTGSAFCFDPWTLYAEGVLTNPNMLLAGVIGQGKSALAKSLAVRSIAAGRRVYVPGDPKGEWAPVAEAVGGRVIALGHGLATRLNPLDAGGARHGASGGQTDGAVRAGAAPATQQPGRDDAGARPARQRAHRHGRCAHDRSATRHRFTYRAGRRRCPHRA